MTDTITRAEDFKLLMPRPSYRPQMLEMTQAVMEACVEFAEKYGMDLSKVHMWDDTQVCEQSFEHYSTFRVVVEFPSSEMWLDTCVIDRDVATSRPTVTTYSTHRDLDRNSIWGSNGYIFNRTALESIFERYHNA